MSAHSWNETYSHSRKPRMRRRKREVGKTMNTIDRRRAREQWENDYEMRRAQCEDCSALATRRYTGDGAETWLCAKHGDVFERETDPGRFERGHGLTWDERAKQGTYDSAVVVAPTAKAARHVHPSWSYPMQTRTYRSGNAPIELPWWDERFGEPTDGWALPKDVKAELVGKARPGLKAGTVICASFCAGCAG